MCYCFSADRLWAFMPARIPPATLSNATTMKGINLGASPEPFLPPQAAGY
jgi:hypothetical protein